MEREGRAAYPGVQFQSSGEPAVASALKASFAIFCLAGAAPAAQAAGAAYYPSLGYGQTTPRYVQPAPAVAAERDQAPSGPPTTAQVATAADGERLSDGFFEDSGGVGPAVVDGGWSGGYWVTGLSGARAFASARAGAVAFVGVRVHIGGHGMSHGCGCR
jgi:hypothetical protein